MNTGPIKDQKLQTGSKFGEEQIDTQRDRPNSYARTETVCSVPCARSHPIPWHVKHNWKRGKLDWQRG